MIFNLQHATASMAASNSHRKIFEDPTNCTSPCDPLKNPPVVECIPTCFFNTTDLFPLSPPPPTAGYILDTPPKHHRSSLSLPLQISLVILVLTFSFFLLYTFYKFYTVWYRSRRRRPPPSPENQETTHDEFLDHDVLDHPIWYIRTIGLQPSVISAITVVKYNKSDGLIDGASCSVCLSDFQQDETLRLLPKCNHAFHVSCIDTWLRSHTNCPLCRAGIVKHTTNLDDLGQIEEPQISISITEDDVDGEQRQPENDRISDLTIGAVDDENKREIVGASGTRDLVIMRRSVSLNDYEACRVRSAINNNNNNNCYSDRHEVQIQSVNGNFEGFELVKVDRTASNRH